jgi:3-carboxy-cis,cis-muconate cycloisomerase
VAALPEAADLDVDALLDPAGYTGLAAQLVDEAVARRSANTAQDLDADHGDSEEDA